MMKFGTSLFTAQRLDILAGVVFFPLLVMALGLSLQATEWVLYHDMMLMHYVAQQLLEGAAPYRDIFDMNLPGTYLLHMAAIELFGEGDTGWNRFVLLWLALTAAMAFRFCWQGGRILPALLAPAALTCFALAQGNEGFGQRDFFMLLFLFSSGHLAANLAEEKTSSRTAAFAAGALLACACWIKPYVGLLLPALAVMLYVWRRDVRIIAFFLGGAALVSAAVLGWLYARSGMDAWLDIVFNFLLPIYSGIGGYGAFNRWLIIYEYIPPFILLLTITAPLTRREAIALTGVICGFLHYELQGKGWPYHPMPFVGWLCVFCACRAVSLYAQGGATAKRATALVTLTCLMVFLQIAGTEAEKLEPFDLTAIKTLEEDIRTAAGPEDGVQIMDVVRGGGIHALYNLGYANATRMLYDFPFQIEGEHAYLARLKEEFLRDLTMKPPQVIVVFRDTFLEPERKFDRYRLFPEFTDYLNEHYTLEIQRKGHRLYVRK